MKTAAKFGRLESGFSPRFFISIRRKFFWQGVREMGFPPNCAQCREMPKLSAMKKFFRVTRAAKKISDFSGVRKFLDFAGGKN